MADSSAGIRRVERLKPAVVDRQPWLYGEPDRGPDWESDTEARCRGRIAAFEFGAIDAPQRLAARLDQAKGRTRSGDLVHSDEEMRRRRTVHLGIGCLVGAVGLFSLLLFPAFTIIAALICVGTAGAMGGRKRSVRAVVRKQISNAACADCGYDLCGTDEFVLVSVRYGSGSRRCPECGVAWPRVPPAAPGE